MIPLVALHGFLGAPDDWDFLRGKISGLELVCPPLPRSSYWNETISALAAEISEGSIVVGYSMGARLALGYALACPDRLGGLVLISGNPGIDDTERPQRWRRDMELADQLDSSDIRSFLRDWYRQAIFQGLTDGQIEELTVKRTGLNRSYQADLLRSNSIARQPNYWSRLADLNLPVLAIAGERDAKYSAIAQRIARETHYGRLEIVSNCGHIVLFEQPDVLINMIRSCISSA
jgi:2-succinyl-6-hydroxy-2,4-cyclohexadiene-1-carboxylate synthase